MLFKYLPPERTDVLTNTSIRFTQQNSLNDPFESAMLLGKEEWELQPGKRVGTDLPTAFVSLSRTRANILMWSHYADCHRGFCIGFRRNSNFFSKAESVRYRSFRASLNGANINKIDSTNVLKEISLEKAVDWSYEEEERLFLTDVKRDLEVVGVDEFGEDIILNKYPAEDIAQIIIGLKTEKTTIAKIKNYIQHSCIDVSILRAVRDKTQYGLTFEVVE